MSGEAEQIWANQLRIYRETEPRSGVPLGDVLDLPCGPAAVSREIEAWLGRLDVWRNPPPQTIAHERYSGRMTISCGRAFLVWFLTQHTSASGGGFNLDRQAPAPTFCLEVETEAGDLFQFRGMACDEIQLTLEPMQIVNLDLSWQILQRLPLDELTAATLDFPDPVVPAYVCGAAWTSGAWGSDPRIDNPVATYRASLFFTRRDLRPCQYHADGVPTRFNSVPWRVIAELKVPRGTVVDAAKSRAVGKLGIFIGPDGADLEFLANVTAYATTDPIKARDHREETLSVEMHPDTTGSLIFMRDNYTP